ncbi:formyltransferase family protein [uncultured Tenacibaculum sp.]|uniref:formyltransferase family protein n=1 Tax=uncultured Tenacibaculum sp. TaxID=174713 RepID=UPI002616E3C7|nr:formyltransferase family protein [uncultured Tenacibaculum sp.]
MIGIITYDTPHRKTQDLITKLILCGYSKLHLIVIPWVERKNFEPIFKHRPSKCVDINIEELASRFSISYSKVEVSNLNTFFKEKMFNHILIAGAGLLPEELVKNHKIINAHPGYLPNVKGLDALKWAIYHGEPIGVTTHYISEKADEGELIEKATVPIYYEDSFHSLAYRVYETEIEMLVNAIKCVERKDFSLESLANDKYLANKRMPHRLEMIMMDRFEELRIKSKSSQKI